MAVQLVWFKKDLRLADHLPLSMAAHCGPVLCVYVIEPEIIHSPEFDSSHQVFINECLEELHQRLLQLGSGLVVLVGNLPEVFERLQTEIEIAKIWCHEETGNDITYKRDLRVQAWCKQKGIAYEELPQTGVIRRLKDRDGWSDKWFARMRAPRIAAPKNTLPHANLPLVCGKIPSLQELGLPPSTKPKAQKGGESLAHKELASFLFERGEKYRYEISSPNSSRTSCSRLSPYLAFGAISLRTVYQASVMRRAQLAERTGNTTWQKSLQSFEERLIWHCHFMQKLEDEPSMEFQNLSTTYDGLRENDFRQDYFDAWCAGQTGYPMIDACMRSLKESGWLNFRMRAMLVSFASYNLWLHWRPTAVYLAKHFLDFEPGIHFAQFQMQSGTTAINSVRVYSAAKQAKDQDPAGEFIRHYVPELQNVPIEFLHQPETMPPLFQQFHGCIIGKDYPAPIVGEEDLKRAKSKVFELRKSEEAIRDANRVFKKHGSRKKPGGKTWR